MRESNRAESSLLTPEKLHLGQQPLGLAWLGLRLRLRLSTEKRPPPGVLSMQHKRHGSRKTSGETTILTPEFHPRLPVSI